MKTARSQHFPRRVSPGELDELRARLTLAEETLRAIRSGEVDAVMVQGKQGPQVFTLHGAEQAYRLLIESMNEGALTLTADQTILYANQCFARMVQCPLERVIGSSLRRFLSADDRATLRALLKRADRLGSKTQVQLKSGGGSLVPAQISIRRLEGPGSGGTITGMVVTDMTEAQRTAAQLRDLTNRLIQAQETERGQVALDLHDNITQLLCAIHFHSQALAHELPAAAGPAQGRTSKICEMLGKTAEEVERISRRLRPGVLDQLGLAAALRATCAEFAHRTGVAIKLACAQLNTRLAAETELTLYRILQEALSNADKHGSARHLAVSLRQRSAFVELRIRDDGIGFDPDQQPARRNGKGGVGLLSMRERATYLGGSLKLKSSRGTGTEIVVRLPLPPKTTTEN